MNKNLYILLLLGFISLPTTTHSKAESSLKKIKSFFGRYKFEKVDQRELPAVAVNTISLTNINGPITIKTGWKKNSVFLKTTKHAKKEDDLNNIKIVVDSTKDNLLAISTKHVNPKLVGLVEYELIVPATLDIALTISGSGDACIKDVNGALNVVTNDNITISNSKKLVSARTLKKGSITINNTLGPVDVHSHAGNIYGENIANSFSANSASGKIHVAYKMVPSTSAINLNTSNNIALALPTDTNAEIRGHTTYGTLTSDHYITLKPYATQLNNCAWNKFKREIDGTIGSGEATIALHSINGNIKISEVKIT